MLGRGFTQLFHTGTVEGPFWGQQLAGTTRPEAEHRSLLVPDPQ